MGKGLYTLIFIFIAVFSLNGQHLTMDGDAQRFYIHHSELTQKIQLDNLIKDNKYIITINSKDVETDDLVTNISNVARLIHKPQQSDFSFTALDDNIDIQINSALALQCFDGLYIAVITSNQVMFSPTSIIQVSQTSIVDQTIRDVFIGGDCFDVSGTTTSGNPASFGFFTGGMSSLGFDEGIIISTGNINSIPGPNTSTGTSDNMGTTTVDPDLNLILQQINSGSFTQRDLAVLEFDFEPTISTLTFEFVFASEEYCDFVNSQFNDVFGFFISGPGISGGFTNSGDNLAVVPGTGDFITINTINHLVNNTYYEDNQLNIDNDPDCAGNDFSTPIAPLDNMFDGLTTALTATAIMIPCETYHIKMAIADVGDPLWDAAVFLKAASFKAGIALINPEIVSDIGGDNIFLEGCEDGFLVFNLAGEPLDTNLVIYFNIDPTSTATAGDDYATLPTTATILAGQTSVSIPIDIFGDLLTEGTESVFINIDQSCSCSGLKLELIIEEVLPLDIMGQDYFLCENETTTLTPSISGGAAPFSYIWSTTETTPSITPTNTNLDLGDNYYYVTVTDICGQEDTTSFNIFINEVPSAELIGSFACLMDSIILEIQFTGSSPWDISYIVDGVPVFVTGITSNPYYFTVTTPGNYILTSVISNNCPGDASGQINVVLSPPLSIEGEDFDLCEGESIVLTPTITGGVSPFTYSWSNFLFSSSITPNDLQFGQNTYSVTVTDICDQVDTTSFNISYTEEPQAVLNSDQNICLIDTVILEVLLFGSPPWELSYTVNNTPVTVNNITSSPYYITVTSPGNYELISVISNNCTGNALGGVNIQQSPPLSVSGQDYELCEGETILLTPIITGGLPPFIYSWSNFLSSSTITPNDLQFGENIYSVTITDICDQVDTAFFNITYTEEPTAILNGDAVICLTDTAVLEILLFGNEPWDLGYTFNTTQVNLTGITDPVFFIYVTEPGLYTLNYVSSNDCSGNALGSATILQSNIIVEINSTNVLCYGDSTGTANINLQNAIPPISYQWSNGVTTDNDTILNLPAGNYSVTITDSTDCPIVRTTIIEQPLPLDITSIIIDTINCNNLLGSILIEAQGGIEPLDYSWTPGDIHTADLLEVASGDYHLVIKDDNNCIIELDTFIPNHISYPTISILPADTINCQNTSIYLDANWISSDVNATTQWINENMAIPFDTNDIIEISTGGNYIFNVINNENFCISSDTIYIIQDQEYPNLNLDNAPEITCINLLDTIGDLNWENENPSYDFQWSSFNGDFQNTSSSSAIITDSSGTFQLITTNSINHCSDTTDITISINQTYPEVFAGLTDTFFCTTNFIQLNGTIFNPGNDTYQWSTVDGNISGDPNVLSPQATIGGNYIFNVTNLDSGCSTSDSVFLYSNNVTPIVNIQTSGIITCDDLSITLSSNNSSVQLPFEYNWFTLDGNFLDLSDTLNPIVNDTGYYYLEITNTLNGCIRYDSILVSSDIINPLLAISLPDTLTCVQTQLPLIVEVIAATNNLDYQWSTIDGHFVSPTIFQTATVDSSGLYYIYVKNNTNGCTTSDSIFVDQDNTDPFLEVLDPDSLNCSLEETALGSTTNLQDEFSILWTTTNGHIVNGETTTQPLIDEPGVYNITLTNTHNGCKTTRSVEVIELPDIANVYLEGTDPTCLGDDGSIYVESIQGGSPPYSYSIDNGQNFYTDSAFVQLPYGEFEILVQDHYACEYTLGYQLDPPAEPNVYLPEVVEIVFGENFIVNPLLDFPESEVDSILWTPSQGVSDVNILRPQLNPVQNTVYTLTIYNQFYCPAVAQIEVRVKFDKDIFIPTAFSPNGDGVNDMFFIQSGAKSIEVINSLQIYERWGTKVFHITNFQPNDPTFGWNGMFNGQYLNPAVFMYWTEVKFVDGTIRIYEGDVTLLR